MRPSSVGCTEALENVSKVETTKGKLKRKAFAQKSLLLLDCLNGSLIQWLQMWRSCSIYRQASRFKIALNSYTSKLHKLAP